MHRKSKHKAMLAMLASTAFVSLFVRGVSADITAVSIGASQYSGGEHASNSEGFEFQVSSPIYVTALDFALQTPLSGLTTDNVRLYSATTVGGVTTVTSLAAVNVLSSDPTTTTGGGTYPDPGLSPVAPAIVYSHHTLTSLTTGLPLPVLISPASTTNYFVAGNIPDDSNAMVGTETYLIYTNTSTTFGPQNVHVATPVKYLSGVENGIFSTQPLNADPITTPFGYPFLYVGYNVNFDFVTSIPTPANLTWSNASGNRTWDTTSLNFRNTSSGTVAYSDTSNVSSGDLVTFNDNNGGASSYNLSIASIVHPTSLTVNNSTGSYTFNGPGGIGGTVGLTKAGSAMLTLSESNSYTGGTNVSAGTVAFAASNAFPANTSLNISAGAMVIVSNHSTNSTYVPTLSALGNNGTIDLTNNAMIVHNGSIGAITSEIAAGYGRGTWTGGNAGSGVITSSLAAADASHLTAVGVATGLTSFEGQTVLPSDVLIKFTYYGDATLDGHVDGSDYSRIDNGFLSNGSLTGWANGDFNYDGVINGSDYTLIDNAFNTQGAGIAAELARPTTEIAAGSSVPEPAAAGLLGIVAVGLLGSRCRRCH